MGLLDKLWDDVVAGPQPEKGLGKLRQSQAAGLPEGFDAYQAMMDRRRSGEFQQKENEARRVAQAITIRKPPRLHTSYDFMESPIISPAVSSPSRSPSRSPCPSPSSCPSPMVSPAAGQKKDSAWRRLVPTWQQKAASSQWDVPSPKAPTVNDWVVISALDK